MATTRAEHLPGRSFEAGREVGPREMAAAAKAEQNPAYRASHVTPSCDDPDDADRATFLHYFVAPSQRDAALDRGAANVIAHLPSGKDFDWTRWHFDALLLHQLEYPTSALKQSDAWIEANTAQVAALLSAKDETAKSCHHGGWLVEDSLQHGLGPVYSTAMGVLMLEVYHRYSPAFPAPEAPVPAPTPPPKKKK